LFWVKQLFIDRKKQIYQNVFILIFITDYTKITGKPNNPNYWLYGIKINKIKI